MTNIGIYYQAQSLFILGITGVIPNERSLSTLFHNQLLEIRRLFFLQEQLYQTIITNTFYFLFFFLYKSQHGRLKKFCCNEDITI